MVENTRCKSLMIQVRHPFSCSHNTLHSKIELQKEGRNLSKHDAHAKNVQPLF